LIKDLNPFYISGTCWKTHQRRTSQGWISMYERSKSYCSWDCTSGVSRVYWNRSCTLYEVQTNSNMGSGSKFWWWVFKVTLYFF